MFRNFGSPNLNFQTSLLEMLEEEIIFIDLEKELRLQVASASLSEFRTLSVMIIKVNGG